MKEDRDEEVHLVIGPFTIKHNDEGSNDVEDKEDGKGLLGYSNIE